MNRSRWVALLLLASWTLNVALVVAWVSRRTHWPEAFPAAPRSERPGPPEWGADPMFAESVAPLHQRRHALMTEMSEVFASDQLDTVRLRQIADSLAAARGQLQGALVSGMIRRHAEMSPEKRLEFCRRMMRAPEWGPPGRGRRQWDRDQRGPPHESR